MNKIQRDVDITDKSARPSRACDMTIGDILREYRTAKDRQQQIKIISELTLLQPRYIRSILAANGFTDCDDRKQPPPRPNYQKWTHDEITLFLELVEVKTHFDELAPFFPAHSAASVKSFAYQYGIRIGQPVSEYTRKRLSERVVTASVRERVFELARQGKTYAEIAQEVHKSPTQLYDLFRLARARGEDVPDVIVIRRGKK